MDSPKSLYNLYLEHGADNTKAMGSLYAWAIHPRAGLNDPCGSTQNILGFCCWGQRRKKKEQKRKLKGGQFVLEFYTFCVVIVCVSIPHISELKEQRG